MATYGANTSCQLQLVRRLRVFLAVDGHVFLTSCLNYIYMISLGMKPSALRKLQVLQNASVFLQQYGFCKYVGPVHCSLHWLPIEFQIKLKVFVFIFKVLHGLAPGYLSSHLKIWDGDCGWQVYCSGTVECSTTWEKLNSVEGRIFSGRLGNEFSQELRIVTDFPTTHSKFKVHVFIPAFSNLTTTVYILKQTKNSHKPNKS